MCTAAVYTTKSGYFGRTLDYEFSYGEEVAAMPRRYALHFRHAGELAEHYAILGMAHMAGGYPLYYDAMNEKGLGMAGLNFVGNAAYAKPVPGKDNVASFEFIPWILGQCADVPEARKALANLNLTDDSFAPSLPASGLHWMLSDGKETLVVESMADGLHIYDNPAGVLTNNPPFPMQLLTTAVSQQSSRRTIFPKIWTCNVTAVAWGPWACPGICPPCPGLSGRLLSGQTAAAATEKPIASASFSTFSAAWTSNGAAVLWSRGSGSTPFILPAVP